MSRIRSSHTKPEIILRSLLHRAGFRFRIHCKDLPGCPDVVLAKYRTAIFVHGCFWHRHTGCPRASVPNRNVEYWTQKFRANKERDSSAMRNLRRRGWNAMVVWECELLSEPIATVNRIFSELEPERANSYRVSMSRKDVLKYASDRFEEYLRKSEP